MNKSLLRLPGLVMLLLTPATIFSQNLPPIAVNDTVYMCGSTVTIYVQDNDYNPDGDPLTISIYAGSINGYFGINGGAINYTPNVGYSGLDTLVYILCDDGYPPMCDTATVYIYVHAEYSTNLTATICSGDSIFLAGAWRTTSGMYVDSLTSQYGCDSVITTTLNVITPPTPSISADGPTTFCTGDSVTLTASNGTGWLWSTGATTQSIVVSTSGNYSVEIADDSGCFAQTAAINVTVTPAPPATITPAGPVSFCSGDSVTLTANSGNAWIWSNGETTQSITVNNSGSYSVTVDYGACASTSQPVYVIELPTPEADITYDGSLTICEGDSIVLYATAGPFSYYWSTGDTTQSITVDTSGTYSVTITNPSGCGDVSASVTVNIYSVPPVNIIADGPTSFCDGDSVTLTATNGSAWTWSTGDTTQSIVVTDAGNYTVTVTDGFCTRTSSPTTIVTDSVPAAIISANGPLTFCEGDSVILTAGTTTATTAYWLWSTGETSQSITVDSSGTYTVTATNSAGCSATSSPVTVNVGPFMQTTISASGPLEFCEGGSVILTGNANGAVSWLWSNGDTTQSILVDSSGSFYVTAYNASGCSGLSPMVTVTEDPAPQATITPNGPTTFCSGDSVILTANAGSAWLWSNGATTQSITVYASGLYSVTVDYGNCSSSALPVPVVVIPAPPASITYSGSLSICQGDSIVLYAVAGPFSYYWSTGETSQSIVVDTSGTYSVTVTNLAGCSDISGSVTVNVNTAPPAVVTQSGSTTFCEGGSVTLTASNGNSWLWNTGDVSQSITVDSSGVYYVTIDYGLCSRTSAHIPVTVNPTPVATITPNGPLSFCSGDSVVLTASAGTFWMWTTGENTQSITVSAAGQYSVIVYNAFGCFAQSAAVNVNVVPAPQATITANGPTTFCSGDYVTLMASQGQSFLWSTGDTTQSISVDDPGYYSVTVDYGACSSTSAPITIIVLPVPNAGISAGGPTTFCEGGSVTLYATGGSSYTWSTGSTAQNITVSDAGAYYVIASNGACEDTSAVVNVIVNPLPVVSITAGGPLSFCEGDSVLLTASNGASWQWSNGATSQSVYWTEGGSADVTLTDANGCSASASLLIRVLNMNAGDITASGPTNFCLGDSCVLTAGYGTSWLWSTGETTESIVVLQSGSYSVISTGACGIDTSMIVNISVSNGVPVAGFGYTANGFDYTFSNSSTGASSYSWNFGDNTTSSEQLPMHSYTTNGTYTVQLISTNACGSDTAFQIIKIDENAFRDLDIYNGFSPNGDGHNDFWNIPLLDTYTDNTVTIVNRWGNEVWKADDYNNRNVIWNGRNLDGAELPDGTYYYIITYGEEERRGWVFIKR